MKHVITEDVNVNLHVDIPAEDLGNLIDKAIDGAITIITVATVAHILKGWLT